MNESIANHRPIATRDELLRYALTIAFVVALPLAFLGYRAWESQGLSSAPPDDTEFTSAEAFEEKHGLRVRLIGVTAGGGMVDVRLKVVDAEQARAFLQEPPNLPRLVVADTGETLVGADELGDDVSWEDGGVLFNLFPNTGGAIQPGTPVIVAFGDLQLEPIPAQ